MRLRLAQPLTAAAILVATAVVAPADAGTLRVSPVGVDLPVGQQATSITLRNDDDTPMNIQVRAFRWDQAGGADHLTPTDEVAVSPPIAPIAPHSERIIRVVRTATAASGEQAYRLLIDELPPPPSTADPQVRFLMRHSIPVFFGAGAPGQPRVNWRTTVNDGEIVLAALNAGHRRLRVNNVRLLDASGGVIASRSGLLGYVLSGAQMSWRLPLAAPGQTATRLVADSDAGPIDVAISPKA